MIYYYTQIVLFIFDFLERTLNTRLWQEQSSEIFVLQYEPYDRCIHWLEEQKKAEKPVSCFTKILPKCCRGKVLTVSEISEEIEEASR